MNASITDTTRAPTLTVGHYRIDPVRTSVRFSTRHLFGLGAVTGTVKLREADFSITEHLSATVHAVLDAAASIPAIPGETATSDRRGTLT